MGERQLFLCGREGSQLCARREEGIRCGGIGYILHLSLDAMCSRSTSFLVLTTGHDYSLRLSLLKRLHSVPHYYNCHLSNILFLEKFCSS
jgi:hypothetical protein